MESILTSVKVHLGIVEEYEHFDPMIIMHINSVFMVLTQMGVGPAKGFTIKDKQTTWNEFIPEDQNLEAVKSYMYLKVRLLFDPPSGAAADAANKMISEFEWRLYAEADSSNLS